MNQMDRLKDPRLHEDLTKETLHPSSSTTTIGSSCVDTATKDFHDHFSISAFFNLRIFQTACLSGLLLGNNGASCLAPYLPRYGAHDIRAWCLLPSLRGQKERAVEED
jgi:hypothetical protein